MAKTNLIGGALWEAYSDKVAERMNHPHNLGEITEADADKTGFTLVVADYGAESCGDAVRLYWLVDPDTEIIKDAKFKSFGCGTAISASDMMCDLCMGKTIDEAVKITNLDVEHALRDDPDTPAVPPQKMHCSVMAYDVIKKAASLYKGIDLSKLDEGQIVCECARVALHTIKDAIKMNDLKTVEDIVNYTKAGGYCKSCIKPGGHEKRDIYIVDILQQTREEMKKEAAAKKVQADKSTILKDDKPFKEKSIVQKMKIIEKVIDEQVRPFLQADGGDAEVTDIQEDENFTYVYIVYLGSCVGCSSAETGTLYAIQQCLTEEIDPNIKVIPG